MIIPKELAQSGSYYSTFSNHRNLPICPFALAACNGVNSCSPGTSKSAPLPINNSTIDKWPPWVATKLNLSKNVNEDSK